MQNKLNRAELFVYFILWTSANLYALYTLFVAQNGIMKKHGTLPDAELDTGWYVISRYKDVSDIEWNTWKYFFESSWHYLLFQFVVSEFLRSNKPVAVIYWYIISNAIYIVMNFGIKVLLVTLFQPMIFFILLKLTNRKEIIWFTGISMLALYNSMKHTHFYWDYTDKENLNDEQVYILFISFGWMQLRCISYCLDYIEENEINIKKIDTAGKKNVSHQDIVDLFGYVLYLPLFYNGPLILHSEFKQSFFVSSALKPRLVNFVKNQIVYLIYTLCLDVALHYIYFLAMQNNIQILRELPTMALCGGGLWMGLEFHLKYVISYGTSGSFASLDNIKPPPNPRCIARIHIYSEMWRYFDVGLYRFLIKYIYKPMLGIINQHINWSLGSNKLLASFFTFAFIYLWHGTIQAIFIWALFNFIGVTFEHFARMTSKTDLYRSFKQNVLKNDVMEQRFVAMLCSPLLALSAISNFYLFAGYHVGNLFFESLTQPTLVNSFILFVSLYSCCHVSIALKNVPSRTPCH